MMISYIKTPELKIGISIPKRLGNAVFRNKNKRRLKGSFRELNIQNKVSMVLIAKQGIERISHEKLTQELKENIAKIK